MFAIIEPTSKKSTRFYKASYKNTDFYWVKMWEKRPNWRRIQRRIGECPIVVSDAIKSPLKRVDTTKLTCEIGFRAIRGLVDQLNKPQRLKRICIEDKNGEFCHQIIPLLKNAGEVSVATNAFHKYLSYRKQCMSNYGCELVLLGRADFNCDIFFSCNSLKMYFNKSPYEFIGEIKMPEGIVLPSGTEYQFAAAMYSEGAELFLEEFFAKTMELPIKSFNLSV